MDRIWASPQEDLEPPPADSAVLRRGTKVAVLKQIAEQQAIALAGEADRGRSVDTRLIAVAAMTPIAVTVLLALTTFLSSGRTQDFTPGSVIVLTSVSFYVALQFLRGLVASVSGLMRRGYYAATPESLVGKPNNEGHYLEALIGERMSWLVLHREANNAKLTDMALAHIAVRNAAFALVVGIFAVLIIVIEQFWLG